MKIVRCSFTNNMVFDGTGGGLYVNTYSNNITLTITDTQIDNNSSYYGGGGVSCPFGTLTISGGEISDNVTRGSGGGILGGYGTLNVDNTAITGNRVTSLNSFLAGGGIYNMGTLNLTNVTIAGNQLVGAGSLGSGLYTIYGIATINNSIIAMNTAASFADIDLAGGTIQGTNNLSSFTGWKDPSSNSIYSKSLPLFMDAANGDYHLAANSQAANIGAYPVVQPAIEVMALSADIGTTTESIAAQPASEVISPLPLAGEGQSEGGSSVNLASSDQTAALPEATSSSSYLSLVGDGKSEGDLSEQTHSSANLAVISSYLASTSMSLDVYSWNQNEPVGWVELAKPNNTQIGIATDEYTRSLNLSYDLPPRQFLFGQASTQPITHITPTNDQGDDSEDQPVTADWSGSDLGISDSERADAIDHFFRDAYDADWAW